jgi:hypothetical protein
MKPSVYVETSLASYLVAWPSESVITAAHQRLTHQWWQTRRAAFDLYVSELVLLEARAGDPDAAARRLAALAGIPVLEPTIAAEALTEQILNASLVPAKARVDAAHIAIAAVHGMDYLLTWNCRHIANAVTRKRIDQLLRGAGYEAPVLCTPEELLED